MNTVVLVTGANRGLGQGLVARYLNSRNHTVVAAVRDPSHSTAKALATLPQAEGCRLIVVKIDVSVWEDAGKAIDALDSELVDHIDIIVANAGICTVLPSIAAVKEGDLRAHLETNTHGVVSLYQAVRPLLQKSRRRPEPIFAIMGSSAASLRTQHSAYPNGVYGVSKAAAHWVGVRINAEDSWLNSFVLNPSLADTDMGWAGPRALGVDDETIKQHMVNRDVVCDGVVRVLANASKAEHGGKLVGDSGKITEW